MDNAGYLLAAFAVIWALVFGYLFLLSERQRRMRREIAALRQALAERDVQK